MSETFKPRGPIAPLALFGFVLFCLSSTAGAADLISVKRISLEIAQKAATEAVEACRADGYQVSVVVVDRAGTMQVALRDVLAPRFTLEIAERKANAVILSGVSTEAFSENRADIMDEMNEIEGILGLAGGVPLTAAGSVVGAIGVSGAPGGDLDAECAEAGVDAVAETLEFAGF